MEKYPMNMNYDGQKEAKAKGENMTHRKAESADRLAQEGGKIFNEFCLSSSSSP
jgi:hypothetical protein